MDLSPNLTAIVNAITDMVARQPLLADIWVFVFSLILLAFLLKLALKIVGGLTNFKYKSLGRLFSQAERYFFLALKQALSDEYEIFAKVRIADILTPDHALSRRNWNSAFYKISSKHFDYVLCDKETLVVIAVIELDDSSHNLHKTRTRDIFVEKACKTAGLKLIRFPCKANYQVQAVRDKVTNNLNSAS
ncbi:DUF2726 domain-containing protein [Nitrosomonas sp. Nm166]|uniref:DUF2726 domain-containing protein n=1 Tax=Nitrosomonas sp. Nm166 TaxID=1881054 RepID=UPI0008E37232|nr:DUF2726 domain-containing protein [Nitrosomonas sp. Nm166]SFF29379.1 Protein of unknown function [Nitrosomonas sp. Nm166]